MESNDESDDTYENVLFRASRIVYPPSLVSPLCPIPKNKPVKEESRVRQSVLNAFDPIAQRKTMSLLKKTPNFDLLAFDLTANEETPPPPVPPRNPRYKVNPYDPVAFDGRNDKSPSRDAWLALPSKGIAFDTASLDGKTTNSSSVEEDWFATPPKGQSFDTATLDSKNDNSLSNEEDWFASPPQVVSSSVTSPDGENEKSPSKEDDWFANPPKVFSFGRATCDGNDDSSPAKEDDWFASPPQDFSFNATTVDGDNEDSPKEDDWLADAPQEFLSFNSSTLNGNNEKSPTKEQDWYADSPDAFSCDAVPWDGKHENSASNEQDWFATPSKVPSCDAETFDDQNDHSRFQEEAWCGTSLEETSFQTLPVEDDNENPFSKDEDWFATPFKRFSFDTASLDGTSTDKSSTAEEYLPPIPPKPLPAERMTRFGRYGRSSLKGKSLSGNSFKLNSCDTVAVVGKNHNLLSRVGNLPANPLKVISCDDATVIGKNHSSPFRVENLPAIPPKVVPGVPARPIGEKPQLLPSANNTKKTNAVKDIFGKISSNLKPLALSQPASVSSRVTPKPELCASHFLENQAIALGFGGMLQWVTSGKRDSPSYWTELKNSVLSSYIAQNGEGPINVWKLDKLSSVGVYCSEKPNLDGFPFDIMTTKSKAKGILVASTPQERNKWMEWILESVTTAFGKELRKCYTRAGKVFLKEGVTGEWQVAWILVQADCKKLWYQYISVDGHSSLGEPSCQDLRKVRSTTKMQLGDGGGCSLALQPGPPLVIHWTGRAFYIQSDLRSETDMWLKLFRSVSLQSGSSLNDCQLTSDDVPALVENCIKFIEAYGILSEGIYRRSGVQSKINRLLSALKVDAWSTHISAEEYTEHDVASALKRFFRTLPEPLLTNELYSQWIAGLTLEQHERRLELYKLLIQSLPHINRQTLRKLLGHLHSVQNKCEKNLMSVHNLAALWGPNLMTVESDRTNASNFSHTNAETDVVLQLIQYYPWLFDVDREQLAVNDAISEIQERIEQGAFTRRNAGDIRAWIRHEIVSEDVAVEIGPKVKVGDVLPLLMARTSQTAGQPTHFERTSSPVLMEVVCSGHLRRPLHSQEHLLPTILKWADWAEEERRDNHLAFTYHPFVDILRSVKYRNIPPKSVFEVHYANPKSKTFRQCPFEFCQARFTVLKDLKNHSVQGRWNVENIFWYLGCDPKRIGPSEWCITFIEKEVPIKKNKMGFGHCLSFQYQSDYWVFLTSLVYAQYEGGILGFMTVPS